MLTKRIIVLGGSGFLGSAIIEGLFEAGYEDITCGDIVINEALKSKFVYIDLLDTNSAREALTDYSLVINCVGQVSAPFNLCYELNSTGMINLAQAVTHESTRVIHISSVSVYGSGDKCNERSPLNPETNYATAKAFSERFLASQLNPNNLSVLRLSNLYGISQGKGIIAYLMKSFQSDQHLTFNNAGDLIRYYLHIEDCVRAIIKVVSNDALSGIYNVIGEAKYTVKELISLIEKRFKMEYKTEFMQISPWENIDDLSSTKLEEDASFKPNWQLNDFIEKELER